MEEKQIQKIEETRNIVKERLENILKTDKNAIVKINNRYEITRPVALALLNSLSWYFANSGYSLSHKTDIQIVNDIVIAKCVISISKDGILIMEFTSVGATKLTEERDTHTAISKAETRALKRAIETAIGEDTINKIILEYVQNQVNEVKISKQQYEFIISKLGDKDKANELAKKLYNKNLNELSYREASEIISKLKNET
ncbi:MAG: hypothetical protein ACO2OO_02110 [Candidatus Aenigmatarchaeota archaeon]